MINIETSVTFNDLNWDTEFFCVSSAKAILNSPLNLDEWVDLKNKFKNYQFISIVNQNSNPVNAQWIGKETSAFLADINIQFMKKLVRQVEISDKITIHNSLDKNEQILEIADFQFSKFTEDPNLAKRGGNQVYHHWLINAFNKPEKFFAISKNEIGEINGFLLYSYLENACVIELIAASKKETKGGIGTSLFKAVENVAQQRGCSEINVGTQIRNTGAINFYNKLGCKQVGCHQVYHLWNI